MSTVISSHSILVLLGVVVLAVVHEKSVRDLVPKSAEIAVETGVAVPTDAAAAAVAAEIDATAVALLATAVEVEEEAEAVVEEEAEAVVEEEAEAVVEEEAEAVVMAAPAVAAGGSGEVRRHRVVRRVKEVANTVGSPRVDLRRSLC